MDNKKQILCHCSNCHKYFNQEDFAYKIVDLYGVPVKEKVCPYCESKGYTRLDQEKYFDRYDKPQRYNNVDIF